MQLGIKNNNFHVYRIKIAGKSLPIMLFPREKPPGFYTKLCLATSETNHIVSIVKSHKLFVIKVFVNMRATH